MAAIAAKLGIPLTGDGKPDAERVELDVAETDPKILELTQGVTPPVSGGDTLAASMAIIAKLKGRT